MVPPLSAPLYDVFSNGAEILTSISPGRLIEPEIMFRVDADLPARERHYETDAVTDAVTAVIGFDSRSLGRGSAPLIPQSRPGPPTVRGRFTVRSPTTSRTVASSSATRSSGGETSRSKMSSYA